MKRVIEKLVDNLDIKNGVIESSAKNIRLTHTIDKIVDDFNRQVNSTLLRGYVSDIKKGGEKNRQFFGEFDESKGLNFKKITNEVNDTTLGRLGIDDKGKLIKGGFIDDFSKNNKTRLKLKEMTTNAISSRVSLKEFKSNINEFITRGGSRTGVLSSEYNTFIYDTFAQIDRIQTGLYADALGLKAFRYAGGTIKTTRLFCCQRNNLIFTTDEAKRWTSLSFQGKSVPYDPLRDLGGYNCRHYKQFMSNPRAARLRDDLTLNDKGKLVRNPKGKRQRLNLCK